MPKASGEIPLRGLNEQMIVVTHLAVRVHLPVEASTDTAKHIEERMPILVPGVDILSPVCTCGDVIQGASELDAKRSGHVTSLAQARHPKKPARETPFKEGPSSKG